MISYPGGTLVTHHGFAKDGYPLVHAGSPLHLLARVNQHLPAHHPVNAGYDLSCE